MKYKAWLAAVPPELTADPLWHMQVYQQAILIGDLAWRDVSKLVQDKRTLSLADQLYRAVGSAREARGWYYQARHLLPEAVVTHRIGLLTQIIRLLLTIIPAERGFKMTEEKTPYDAHPTALLDDLPLP